MGVHVEALAFPFPLDSAWNADAFATYLRAFGEEKPSVTPTGRQLKGPTPDDPIVVVKRLAAALLPFADQYPLPFFAVER